MHFNKTETTASFAPTISDKYFRFLDEREVVSEEYRASLKSGLFGILTENVIMIDNKPFCVNCILGESEDSIFDIIGTNQLYAINANDGTVFSVLYGDDYLFFKPNDTKVYYKSISTDEIVTLADSYNAFLSMVEDQDI